jgi:MYXO-CTERM domain-containing protein
MLMSGPLRTAAFAFALALLPGLARSQLPPFDRDPSLPQDIVCNSAQGMGISSGQWVDIEPGQLDHASVCRAVFWINWNAAQPDDGTDWSVTPIDWSTVHLPHALDVASQHGKGVWIYFYTDGVVPQWAVARGVEVVCGLPAPWDTTYHELLSAALRQLDQYLTDKPTVDGIFMMSGGDYGEMFLHDCDENDNGTGDWIEHGYTAERFADGCRALIDAYMAGIERLPVALQIGSGLDWNDWVARDVAAYAAETYGLRVGVMYNGWGGSLTHDAWHTSCLLGGTTSDYWRQILSSAAELTLTGYQPSVMECFAAEADFQRHVDHLLTDHAAFAFLPPLGTITTGAAWEEAIWEDLTRHAGAHPILLTTTTPEAGAAPGTLAVGLTWTNRGNLPLRSSHRDGVRGAADSYHVTVDVVRADGQSVARSVVRPTPPTHEWTTGLQVSVPVQIDLPAAMAAGDYSLRVGLCDPNHDGAPWRFVPATAADEDAQGRRTVATIGVANPNPTGDLPPLAPCGEAETVDGGVPPPGQDAGTGGGGGGDGGVPGGGASASAASADAGSSGCGCRMLPAGAAAGWAVLVLALGLASRLRRRRGVLRGGLGRRSRQ